MKLTIFQFLKNWYVYTLRSQIRSLLHPASAGGICTASAGGIYTHRIAHNAVSLLSAPNVGQFLGQSFDLYTEAGGAGHTTRHFRFGGRQQS